MQHTSRQVDSYWAWSPKINYFLDAIRLYIDIREFYSLRIETEYTMSSNKQCYLLL